MSIGIKIVAGVGVLAVGLAASAFVLQANPPAPGIVGFGAQTDGGAGGEIVKVTTLDETGEGSLRWAIETADGPRLVEFDVSGTILLTEQIEIGDDISILGGTSPEGITVAGSRLRVIGSDVIISGMRLRPGDGAGSSLESRDGISVGKSGHPVRNVVIDGNSLTWAVDENMALWGDVQNVTISNNIIADALDEAGHPKGDHGMGLLIGGGDVSRVTVVGNLFANNPNRNPLVKDQSREIEVINNLIYNWSENGLTASDSTVHAIGNVYRAGPDSVVPESFVFKNDNGLGAYYLQDNVGSARQSDGMSETPVFEGSGVAAMPADQVWDHVLETVGARAPSLDQIDQMVLEGVIAGTGRIINTPPVLAETETAQTN